MYMRKKKFMQEDSAISGLLPKLVHKQYFLPILVAAAGWQKLSKVLQQNTDMAKSLLEAGEWSDLINKLHEEGNWDAYRVGFNPLRDTMPRANVGAQLQEDILRPIARSHEFKLYCQNIRTAQDIPLHLYKGISQHMMRRETKVRERERLREKARTTKKRGRERGFEGEEQSDSARETEGASEGEIEREIERKRNRLQEAERERDSIRRQGGMVLEESEHSEEGERERARRIIRRRRQRANQGGGKRDVHTFNMGVHHIEVGEERDVGEGHEKRSRRAGMRDKGRKRERKKAREARQAKGKMKKISDEAARRREKRRYS